MSELPSKFLQNRLGHQEEEQELNEKLEGHCTHPG